MGSCTIRSLRHGAEDVAQGLKPLFRRDGELRGTNPRPTAFTRARESAHSPADENLGVGRSGRVGAFSGTQSGNREGRGVRAFPGGQERGSWSSRHPANLTELAAARALGADRFARAARKAPGLQMP